MITASPVLGSLLMVMVCASRSSAQALSWGEASIFMNGANCTNRKGNSPARQSSRQLRIIAGNSV